MRRMALAALGVSLATVAGSAQDPVATHPKVYRVLADNARVRVLRVSLGAGEKVALHEHPDHVVVLVTDAKGRFTGADGKSEVRDMKSGQAMFTPAGKHATENVGAAPLEAIVVELKGAAAPKAVLPTSRPEMTMTKLVEHARVDVMRISAGAGFKEPAGTTHDYDQVVVAMAPATFELEVLGKKTTSWKKGDVHFIGRGDAHQSANTGGKPLDFIIVAVK